MKKLIITCDCCMKEIEESEAFTFSHYVHVGNGYNKLSGHVKIIDGGSHRISQRIETKEFCLPCYNEVLSITFSKINEIQSRHLLNPGDKVFLKSNPEVELTVTEFSRGFASVEWFATDGLYRTDRFDIRVLSKY